MPGQARHDIALEERRRAKGASPFFSKAVTPALNRGRGKDHVFVP